VRQLRAAGLIDDSGNTVEAVNYGVLATYLGGGASYDPLQGFTGPTYVIGGNSYGNVGSAFAAIDQTLASLDTRITTIENTPPPSGGTDPYIDIGGTPNHADASAGTGAVAIGPNANASGDDSVAIGNHASATAPDSVAIGTGSVADRPDSVSVGSVGEERQITNVAAGTADTDAANVGQMNAGDARTLADARAYTDRRFEELMAAPMAAIDELRAHVDDRFSETDRRIDKMGAMNAAMLNMATSAAGVRTQNRVGVGIGFSGGEQALSFGYQRAIGERATLTFGGAFSSDESSAGAGIGFGW